MSRPSLVPFYGNWIALTHFFLPLLYTYSPPPLFSSPSFSACLQERGRQGHTHTRTNEIGSKKEEEEEEEKEVKLPLQRQGRKGEAEKEENGVTTHTKKNSDTRLARMSCMSRKKEEEKSSFHSFSTGIGVLSIFFLAEKKERGEKYKGFCLFASSLFCITVHQKLDCVCGPPPPCLSVLPGVPAHLPILPHSTPSSFTTIHAAAAG